jgi:hypothetical protein
MPLFYAFCIVDVRDISVIKWPANYERALKLPERRRYRKVYLVPFDDIVITMIVPRERELSHRSTGRRFCSESPKQKGIFERLMDYSAQCRDDVAIFELKPIKMLPLISRRVADQTIFFKPDLCKKKQDGRLTQD